MISFYTFVSLLPSGYNTKSTLFNNKKLVNVKNDIKENIHYYLVQCNNFAIEIRTRHKTNLCHDNLCHVSSPILWIFKVTIIIFFKVEFKVKALRTSVKHINVYKWCNYISALVPHVL